ncbi:MAG: protein kinase [Deltaproteobacteria bacterium]|nr:protein kinase [Deltaproteobacteria bacterium]
MEPGQVIADRYQLVRRLGSGANATAWVAEDRQSNTLVALKRLDLRGADDWKRVDLFEREARVLAQLSHPRIPRYLGYFTVGHDGFFLVQQLGVGRTCAAIGRVDEREARRIAREVLEILAYLHELKPPVLHRDVKPSNLIHGEDGHVLLVDFGAVRELTDDRTGSTVIGTVGYAAPEQYRGAATPRSDLFGVGATLVFLLYGCSPAELPQNRLRVRLPSTPRLSPSFRAWLLRMVEPAPEDRFASAREAVAELDRVQRPTRAIVLGATLAVLCVGGLVLVARTRATDANDPRRAAVLEPRAALPARLEVFRYPEIRTVRSVPAHTSAIFGIRPSPDGKLVATASWDGTATVWSTESWAALATFGHKGKTSSVSFLDDGKTLVTGGDTKVRLWDVATRTEKLELDAAAQVTGVDVSRDGKMLVASSFDGNARAWSLPDGKPLRTFAHSPGKGRVFDTSFTPDGALLATCGDDATVKMWNPSSGALRGTLAGHEKGVTQLAFSADGTLIASSSDDASVRVHAVNGFQPIVTLRAASDEVWSVAFSPDGRFLAAGSRDARLRVYARPSFWQRFNVPDESNGTLRLAFAHDGRTLYSGHGDGTFRVWSLPTDKPYPLPEAKMLPDPQLPDGPEELVLARRAERMIEHWEGKHTALDAAEVLVRDALARSPKHALSLVMLARITLRRGYLSGKNYRPGVLDRATKLVDDAIASDPKLIEARTQRAFILLRLEEDERARAALVDAAAIAPDHPRVHGLYAELAVREKAWSEAERRLKLVLEGGAVSDEIKAAYDGLLEVYEGMGEYDAMDEVHRRIVAASPKSAWAHGNYARFLNGRGQYGKAIELAKRAVDISDYGMVHAYLASSYVQAGVHSLWDLDHVDRAREWFEAALREDPRSANARYGLAATYRADGVRKRDSKLLAASKSELEAALKLDKDHPWAKRALAEHAGIAASVGG